MKVPWVGFPLLILSVSAAAQLYPMPASVPVPCEVEGCNPVGAPTYPFSAPFVKHSGRYVDSTTVRELQAPIRTYRAQRVAIVPERDRIYMRIGSATFATYRLSTFFSTEIGSPMVSLNVTNRTYPEKYLPFLNKVDPENDPNWTTVVADGQDRLGANFDWDDRGYIYLPYSIWGWGIYRDGATFDFIRQYYDHEAGAAPDTIIVVKSDAKYYAILNKLGVAESRVADVTVPDDAKFVRDIALEVHSYAKLTLAGQQVTAITDLQSGQVKIYTAAALIAGAAPERVFTPSPSARFWSVTSDGNRFFAVEGSATAPAAVVTFSPTQSTASSFIESGRTQISDRWFLPRRISYSQDTLAVTGLSADGYQVELYRVASDSLERVDLGPFLSFYYGGAVGYAGPSQVTGFDTAVVRKEGGRQYLVVAAVGLGDVFEIMGETMGIGVDGTSWGTPNPYSAGSGGPFYGDVISFTTSSVPDPLAVEVDFGNPEAGDANVTTTVTRETLSYRYSGITALPATRTVRLTGVLDPTRTAETDVSMMRPAARIRVKETALLFTQPNASATARLLHGQQFADASDGSVESHYASWTVGGVLQHLLPSVPVSVGPCTAKPRTVSLTARYGYYDAEFAQRTQPDFSAAVPDLAYTVLPFTAAIAVDPLASDSTAVTFVASSSVGVGAIAGDSGASARFRWDVLDPAGNPLLTPVYLEQVATLGSNPSYRVDAAHLVAGYQIRLTVTLLDPSLIIESCRAEGMETSSQTLQLKPPDPVISIPAGECTTYGGACSVVTTSSDGQDQTFWRYSWYLDGVLRISGTGPDYAVFTPSSPAVGSHSVRVDVRNEAWMTASSNTIAFEVIEPPCTGVPFDVYYTHYGVTSGCTGDTCTAAESIQFFAKAWTYAFQSCDSFLWAFGDGGSSSEMSPVHKFPANGSYLVTLKVSNDNGSTTFQKVLTLTAPVAPVVCQAPNALLSVTYSGLSSGCTSTSATLCNPGEVVRLTAWAWGSGFQACDRFDWSFGDGTPAAANLAVNTVDHVFSGARPDYAVTLTVKNTVGSASVSQKVKFVYIPIAKPTDVDFTVSPARPVVGQPVTFTGTATAPADHPITLWKWNFGDGTSRSGNPIQHTFSGPGPWIVTLTARNEGGDAPPIAREIALKKAFAYLLPVVSHVDGANESKWRTDVQLFNRNTSDGPIELEFELTNAGIRKTLRLDTSTWIYPDFMTFFNDELTALGKSTEMAGPVIVRCAGDHDLQIWTRTYSISSSGTGTYGHLIPAVPIGAGQDFSSRTTFYLTGVSATEAYRTNIYLLNVTPDPMDVTITAFEGDLGSAEAQLTVNVEPLVLTSISASSIEGIPKTGPFSLGIEGSARGLIAYESVVDNASNDPIYIPAIATEVLADPARRTQIVPSVGRFGSWRSDLTVFNPDDQAIRFDFSFRDGTGALVAEAKDQILPAKGLLQVEDLIRAPSMIPQIIDDVIGTLRVDVVSPFAHRSVVVAQRNYSDAGDGRRFGQGILAFAAGQPNVRAGNPAVLPGIRNDDLYYSNVGLVNVGAVEAAVRMTLLDDETGEAIGVHDVALAPDASTILPNVIPQAFFEDQVDRGSVRIEVTNDALIWAFASVIDRSTKDPEYVPAIPLE